MNTIPINPDNVRLPKNIQENRQKADNALQAISSYNEGIKGVAQFNPKFTHLFLQLEAETTTRLEGTQVTFKEVVLGEDSDDIKSSVAKPRTNQKEALGVLYALQTAEKKLKQLPLTNKIITEMHKILMQHAMRDQGVPGEFRKMQVRIGEYIPPAPQHVKDLMYDLERYINDNNTNLSPLVKIAIVHAQFEIIHPFGDGNGRIGRLLIPLLARQYGLTTETSFFISEYLEHREIKKQYYSHLNAITEKGEWAEWVNFFLDVVTKHANAKMKTINELKEAYTDGNFLKFRSSSSQHIKNFIFKKPVFTIPQLIRHCEKEGLQLKNKASLSKTLSDSPDIGILIEGKGRRVGIFYSIRLFKILERSM